MTDGAENYRYTRCGLDNVVLVGLPTATDDAGEPVVIIPYVNQLHRVIAHELATKATGLSHKELRFLRTELGLTQAELASVVHRDHQSIGRWERGEKPIDRSAETIIRLLTLERLGLDCELSVEELSKRTLPTAAQGVIAIDAHNPSGGYKPLAA